MRALLWFRGKDLRVSDHEALSDICRRARELVPVFVLSPRYFEASRARKAPHRMQYLLAALHELRAALEARGSRLLIVSGPAEHAIPRLAAELQIAEVLAIASSEPAARKRDARVAERLHVPLTLYPGETLIAPGALRTAAGGMFQVFTPFARAFRAQARIAAPLSAPERIPPLPTLPQGAGDRPLPTLAELGVDPNPVLIAGGEAAARARLDAFLKDDAVRYHEDRDRLDLAATSGISADLHFGSLSIRSAFHATERRLTDRAPDALARFHDELLWRELAYHWLHERPNLLTTPFRSDFIGFPWQHEGDPADQHQHALGAWAAGRTGYPIVDAAARQLLTTGFVHNRARMISASFLCKHLLVHYAHGEAHYLKWLVDGDLACNNQGWQWSAGTGCDAQPYFRVFNPVTQGQRFDPNGDYVRRYLPELRALPNKHIHAPWQATDLELRAAGVTLGDSYPHPIVDHADARTRFLLVAQDHLGQRRGASAS